MVKHVWIIFKRYVIHLLRYQKLLFLSRLSGLFFLKRYKCRKGEISCFRANRLHLLKELKLSNIFTVVSEISI